MEHVQPDYQNKNVGQPDWNKNKNIGIRIRIETNLTWKWPHRACWYIMERELKLMNTEEYS